MKISVFTGTYCDPQRQQAVKEAASMAHYKHHSDLLIFPGNSMGNKKSRNAGIQKIADENKIAILAGFKKKIFLFRPKKSIRQFPEQKFAYSSPNQDKEPKKKGGEKKNEGLVTQRRVKRLIDFFSNGERIFKLGGKRIAVLLCGENNILCNVRGEKNAAHPRYGIPWPLDKYDVLVNPTHTSMGHWNLLHRRFAYFSQKNRTVIYSANNTRSKSWKTSLCIYNNGKQRLMGDLENYSKECTHIEDKWRIVTTEV
jgi:hypothetical protein